MTADDPTELRLKQLLRMELDGATGQHPVWRRSPAYRATGLSGTRSRPQRAFLGLAAAMAVLVVVGAAALLTAPQRSAFVAGPVSTTRSPLPTLGTQVFSNGPALVVAGQSLDVDTGDLGPVVVAEPPGVGTPGHAWQVTARGAWRDGPELAGVPAPPDATVAETWASDGDSLARLVAFGTTRTGNGNAVAYREIWIAPLAPGAMSRKVASIDDLIDAPSSTWDPAGRLLPMPGGGYVVTKASSLLIVRPDGTLDRQALPPDRMVMAPTSDPGWFIVGSVAGARSDTAHAPYRAMLWSRDGRELPVAGDVTGVAPSIHRVGRAWVQRDHGDWYPLDADGLLGPGLPNTVTDPVRVVPMAPVGIDPSGTWVILASDAASGRSSLVAAGTGGTVAQTDGAPMGQLAWLGGDVLFAQATSDPAAFDGDGGLIRMGADGVNQVSPRWTLDLSSTAGATPDSSPVP
jgi:hypothetical protein